MIDLQRPTYNPLENLHSQVQENAADTPRPPERVDSTPPRQELQYFHVDDQDLYHTEVAKSLGELEIRLNLGNASSAEGAIQRLETLLREEKYPHVIILDQSFFVEEGDNKASAYASIRFAEDFMQLTQIYPRLKQTSIVMYSSSVSPQDLEKLRRVCPNISGLAEKGLSEMDAATQITAILAKQGQLQIDDVVEAATRKFDAFHEQRLRSELEGNL